MEKQKPKVSWPESFMTPTPWVETECSICKAPAPTRSQELLKKAGWSGGQIASETTSGHKINRYVLFCPAHKGNEIAVFIAGLIKDPEAP